MAPWAASATPQGMRSGAAVVSAWARFGMLFQKPTPFRIDQRSINMQGDEPRLELGSFCQKWGVRSVYVLITPSSTDREFNNEIGSALYLARTNYGTDIHLCYLG